MMATVPDVTLATADTLVWQWPQTPVGIALILAVALLGRWLVHRAINQVVRQASSRARSRETNLGGRAARVLASASLWSQERRTQRTATMGSLLRSLTSFLIAAMAILTIMSAVGLPLTPLLSSAGVGGVALGIGAQSLVKDFLSGVFMIVEDQYGVGDVVDTGEAVGTVEEVTLRVTRLRDANGVVWYVRNGEIVRVANRSQGWATALVDVPVAYDEDPERVIGVLREAMAALDADQKWSSVLLEAPEVVGVESMNEVSMTLRVVAKCAPNENWGVQREIRERAKMALDAAGVRGPALSAFRRLPPDAAPA
jgi:small conductance mechanosensitive channel